MDLIVAPQNLPPKAFKGLTCSKCKKPLSRFPIYTHTITGCFICGRCAPLTDLTDYIHSWAYEKLADFAQFACSHRPDGCRKLLFPKQVETHEKTCKYLKYECALRKEQCPWEGFYDQYLAHFRESHADFILNGKVVEIDFDDKCERVYLLTFREELFVVTIKVFSILRRFICTVAYIGRNSEVDKMFYVLEFSGSNVKCSFRTVEKMHDSYEINENELNQTLHNPEGIRLRMEILNEEIKEETDIDVTNKEKPYECPSCLEFLLPPIYQCITGHSICETCKNIVMVCPMCRAPINNTRNFALEDIMLMKTISCKHSNCTLKAKGSEIQQHQKWCIHGPLKCPFFDDDTPCERLLLYSEINEHVTNNHPDSMLLVHGPVGFYSPNKFKKIYVMKHESHFFRLLSHRVGEKLCWSLQLIGNGEDAKKYKFMLNFKAKGRVNMICMQGACVPMMETEKCFQEGKNYLYVDKDQVRMLLNSGTGTGSAGYILRIINEGSPESE